jgi:hypothetical protein
VPARVWVRRTFAEGVVVLNGVHEAACGVRNGHCAVSHGVQLVQATRLKPAQTGHKPPAATRNLRLQGCTRLLYVAFVHVAVL